MKNLINKLSQHNYYVNLASSVKKRELMEGLFEKHDLDFERIEAISGEGYTCTGTMIANYKAQDDSFAKVFKDAIENNYSSILVMEDDIVFTDNASEVLEGSLEHLPNDWDCFSLGCISNRFKNYHIGGQVYKIRYACLGNAWFFKSSMFQPMLDELTKKEKPYDVCISTVFRDFDKHNAYAILKKGIAYQRAGYSDNLGKYVDNSEIS